MPKNVVQYDLLISCPGDIISEISIIEDAVSQFNTQFSDALGISIRTKHWRKNSYAQSGGKPQALLNEQFVNDCDAAVAILWTRFGTPTDEYGSGTEEEVEIMLSSGKQVFMYFSDKPIPPSQMNEESYKKVQAFRDKYKDRGFYFTYSSDEEFKSLFFAHISQHFLSEKRVSEVKKERQSKLKLMGINNQQLDDIAHVVDFIPNVGVSKEQFISDMTSLIHEISEMHLKKRTETKDSGFSTLSFSINKPVEIDTDECKTIRSVAEILNVELPEDFFCLGDLSQSPIPATPFGGGQLIGTNEEKEKYRKIERLNETISECLNWAPIENAFSGKKCIKLALQNSGTAVDEDIEISIKFPRECVVLLQDFPSFNNVEQGYLLNDCDMKKMFGIASTPEYSNYYASIVNKSFVPSHHATSSFPGITPNYSDDFVNELEDTFCYDFFETGETCIIKLKFEYIKHHTTIAFPTVIFVQGELFSAEYSITSRNAPEVINGIIEISSSD